MYRLSQRVTKEEAASISELAELVRQAGNRIQQLNNDHLAKLFENIDKPDFLPAATKTSQVFSEHLEWLRDIIELVVSKQQDSSLQVHTDQLKQSIQQSLGALKEFSIVGQNKKVNRPEIEGLIKGVGSALNSIQQQADALSEALKEQII